MKKDADAEESAWDRSYRDPTPSDADLSDYDPSYVAIANLDISNRIDNTEFTRTPFTIAQSRAKAKNKANLTLNQPIQPPNPQLNGKKEAGKGNSKLKKPIGHEELVQATEDDPIVDPDDYTKEDTEESSKKTKKPKKVRFGGYSSYAEWDAAEERAARAGGPPIVPAAIQLPPTKKEEKRRYNNWSKPASGWLDSTGRSKPTTKPIVRSSLPLPGFASASAHAAAANQSKKRKAATPAAPSLLEALDAAGKEDAKKAKITKAADKVVKEKKEPAKKGKVASKGTKAKSRGKKDDDDEPSLKFGRLPKGAAPNDDFPILKGFEKMKGLPVKKRSAQVDLDKLIPLTKSQPIDSKKKNDKSIKNSKNQKTFKSAEMIDIDDEDNDSIDPLSDTEDTVHASSATLKGSGRMTNWFSQALEKVPQEVKSLPSLDRTNPTEATDTLLTPQAEHQHDHPSTMTHLSDVKPRPSEYATSSSQLPYSSPFIDKNARSNNNGIMNPIPVRDKSSQIAHLQRMAKQGDSGKNEYYRKPFPSQAQNGQDSYLDKDIVTAFPEDDDIKEEAEQWSTLRPKQSRYADRSLNREDEYQQPGSKRTTALFPQQGYTQQARPAPAPASRYNKITLFQPPSRPAQQTTGYTIARIPNGARKAEQQQHVVEEMQWTGTPQRNRERQSVKTDLSYLQTADAARPKPVGNWKDDWLKSQKAKPDISQNKLGRYALNKDVKRGEVDGQGRAFRT